MSDENEKAVTQPFAFFQFNTGWGVWEQVVDEARDREDVVAAYRSPVPAARDVATAPDSDTFECIAYDAHCPSMTVRFRVPEGFPLAGGVFRIQRARTATAEDRAKFGHLSDAPEMSYDDTDLDALGKIAEMEKP